MSKISAFSRALVSGLLLSSPLTANAAEHNASPEAVKDFPTDYTQFPGNCPAADADAKSGRKCNDLVAFQWVYQCDDQQKGNGCSAGCATASFSPIKRLTVLLFPRGDSPARPYMYYYIAELPGKPAANDQGAGPGTVAQGFTLDTRSVCGTVNMDLLYAGGYPNPRPQFFIGTWNFQQTVHPVPWKETVPEQDDTEGGRVKDASITISQDIWERATVTEKGLPPDQPDQPSHPDLKALACPQPKILVLDSVSADQLFDGALKKMHTDGNKKSSQQLAKDLKFGEKNSWESLSACGTHWYFADQHTAEIRVRDKKSSKYFVYTLIKKSEEP